MSDGYFRTLGIPLHAGRAFGPEDGGGPPTVVISRAMARRFWPNGGALGGRLRLGPDPTRTPHTVVGIVGDVRNDPARPEAEPITHLSNRAKAPGTRTVLVRTGGDPLALVTPFRRALAAVDPGVPMRDATPLAAFFADRMTARRLPAALMGAFGALALALAYVGVYAMFAALVAARSRYQRAFLKGLRCAGSRRRFGSGPLEASGDLDGAAHHRPRGAGAGGPARPYHRG